MSLEAAVMSEMKNLYNRLLKKLFKNLEILMF